MAGWGGLRSPLAGDDGRLDLFVANYVKFNYQDHVVRTVHGYPQYPSPKEYQPDRGCLFRNRGDGTVVNVPVQAGKGMQVRLCPRGVKSNRDGVGARVKVVAGDLVQIDEVHRRPGGLHLWKRARCRATLPCVEIERRRGLPSFKASFSGT